MCACVYVCMYVYLGLKFSFLVIPPCGYVSHGLIIRLLLMYMYR
jgi:hypothetical protein